MKTSYIAIISKDTIMSLGIKALLNELFNINPTIFNSTSILTKEKDVDKYDLYIVDSNIYLCNQEFFILRKKKTIIISDCEIMNQPSINRFAEKETIINKFSTYITQVKDKSAKEDLSQREIEVLKLIASGLLNKEIADQLNISINTVLSHRKNITFKLGIKSVSGLSVYAMMNGYITNL